MMQAYAPIHYRPARMTGPGAGPFAGFILALLALVTATSHAGTELWGDPCRAADEERSARVGALYRDRERAPIWVTVDGRSAAGMRLVAMLRAAEASDRRAGHYITRCLDRALRGSDEQVSRGQLDVMLTDAYLALAASRVDGSRSTGRLLAPLGRDSDSASITRWLDRLAQGPARDTATTTTTGRPAPATRDLAAALEHYRRIRAAGGWQPIGPGPDIAPGDRDPRVPALRERLAATGDLAADDTAGGSSIHDDALASAVRAFQDRHGLRADGVVDARTRRALDVPVEARIDQIRVNLERMRAHAVETDGPVVRVNIPDFRVELHHNGRIEYETRAVVGRPGRPTPVLAGRITHFTLNPAWNVPASIVREDLAPRFAADPAYAERNGFRLRDGNADIGDIDWADSPDQAVRQAPGPANALGGIKFEMPNRRAIFLHDTPQRHLFRAEQRAFSAGCVRVQEPLELATRLARSGEAGRQQLAAGIRSGQTRAVHLGRAVPVQLVYFTAWADADGSVRFRDDIYGKDDEALAALDSD